MNNSVRWNGRVYGETVLMMVRGGGDSDDDVSDGESYDEYDPSDDIIDAEVISFASSSDDDNDDYADTSIKQGDQSDEEKLERAQKHTQLSSQSRNFGIATALWASLFFDTILNTKKRLDLFPTLIASGAAATTAATTTASVAAAPSLMATLVPTSLLASGFGLATGVAFLLWRDLEVRADMTLDDGGDKGDWFLSLSSVANSDDKSESTKEFAKLTRERLLLHLSLFGLLCLGAHAGYYFSNQAPFLGMSAAVINVHNTLACVSTLMKERGLASWMTQFVTWPLKLFQGNGGERSRLEMTSFAYRLFSVVAWAQCIPVCKRILSLGSGLSSGVAGATDLVVGNNARLLSLQIVSLARLTLAAGVSQTLYASSIAKSDSMRLHPFFAVLSGILGVGCLGVGGSVLFDSFRSLSSGTVLLGEAVGGTLLVMFGIFNAVSILIGRRQSMRGAEPGRGTSSDGKD